MSLTLRCFRFCRRCARALCNLRNMPKRAKKNEEASAEAGNDNGTGNNNQVYTLAVVSIIYFSQMLSNIWGGGANDVTDPFP